MSTQKPGKGQVLRTTTSSNISSKQDEGSYQAEPATDERRKMVTAFNEKEMGALWYLADRLAASEEEASAFVDEALKNWKQGYKA